MPKQWTEEHTTEAVRMWRKAYSLEDIGEALEFASATVSTKLQENGDDMVTYGLAGREGLEAGSKPRRMGDSLSRGPRTETAPELIEYQPSRDDEYVIQALIANEMAQDRQEAMNLLMMAGTRDEIVREAINLEDKIVGMRDELRRKIEEGEL